MLKYIIVLVVLMSFEEIAISQYKIQSDLRLKETNVLYKENPEFGQKEKSPALSGFLSFMLPGAAFGQFENEQYLDGAIRVMVSLISGIWFFETAHFIDMGGTSRPGAWQVYAAASIFAANWISSVPDAVIYAATKNRKIRMKNGYMKKDSGFNMNLGYGLHGLTLRAGLSF